MSNKTRAVESVTAAKMSTAPAAKVQYFGHVNGGSFKLRSSAHRYDWLHQWEFTGSDGKVTIYSQFSRKQAKAIRLSVQSVSRRFTDSA